MNLWVGATVAVGVVALAVHTAPWGLLGLVALVAWMVWKR